jgi:hypothetical protein
MKFKGYTNDTMKELKDNQKKINDKHKLEKGVGLFSGLLPMKFRQQIEREVKKEFGVKENPKEPSKCEPKDYMYRRIIDPTMPNFLNKNRPTSCTCRCTTNTLPNCKCTCHVIMVEKEDLTLNSGKVLILLTEAPTTSIIQWSSCLYESFGSQKKMISTGYHTPDVWKSIIFQLVYTFAVLQKNCIYMENVTLADNIYIKDIFSDPNAIGSWIYKVDNVDYYIPNYGYILMFDSKYADISPTYKLVKDNLVPSDKHKKFKLYGKIYGNEPNHKDDDIQDMIYNQFKDLIDPDNFGHNFKAMGGSPPDETILKLLTDIHDADMKGIIRDLIPKFFRDYVHNRVGTLLMQSEKANINMLSKPNFNKGKLMIYQRRNQEFEWVIYLGDNAKNVRKKDVITCKNNNYVEEEVFANSLYSYPDGEIIYPETKKNMKYDETHIYETYCLD